MIERMPTPAEVTAYANAFFHILKQSHSILQDAAQRGESQEVINHRFAKTMVVLGVDWESLRHVDAYLSAVEDESPLRPMRYAILGQILARMDDAGMSDDD